MTDFMMNALALPGGVGLSHLKVYDTPAPDGLVGGSAHVHLACKEAYLVVAGEGAVQTLSAAGFREVTLEPGKLVWFTPGLIHRLVNGGGLEIVVVMANAGMPEAGDFALTFPNAVMQDAQAYKQAISLASAGHVHASGEAAAYTRRDLATEGFLELRETFEKEGTRALETFYRYAAERIQEQGADWHGVHDAGPVAEVEATEARLTALEAGKLEYLEDAGIYAALPPETRRLGMCGRLDVYTPEGRVL
jgi:mannose-6-phosphate isomerase-like protein (cupin superfamily)